MNWAGLARRGGSRLIRDGWRESAAMSVPLSDWFISVKTTIGLLRTNENELFRRKINETREKI